MELAWLSEVAGREGGASPDPGGGGVEFAALVDTDRGIAFGGGVASKAGAGLPESG